MFAQLFTPFQRPEVKDAITACHTAGIRPIMVTGHHLLTASAIANQTGLNGTGRVLTGVEIDTLSDEQLRDAVGQVDIYARTMPEHKLRIIHALHARGEIVAATGDGTNDGPALAAADIGVAMGQIILMELFMDLAASATFVAEPPKRD